MNDQHSLFQEQAAKTPATSSSPFSGKAQGGTSLEAQLKTAQRQLSNVLILMFVLSGTFAIFLLQQVRYDRADLSGLRAQEQQLKQAKQTIANYNEQSVPIMRKLVSQLQEFSKSNPSVLPILVRYNVVQPAVPPAGATAPGTP